MFRSSEGSIQHSSRNQLVWTFCIRKNPFWSSSWQNKNKQKLLNPSRFSCKRTEPSFFFTINANNTKLKVFFFAKSENCKCDITDWFCFLQLFEDSLHLIVTLERSKWAYFKQVFETSFFTSVLLNWVCFLCM